MMRIALLLMTNLAVMLVFGVAISLMGVQSSSIKGLIMTASLFGYGGAFLSLLMSKWIALRAVGGKIISTPSTETEYWLLEKVRLHSRRAGISIPQIAIYHGLDMNAFATGMHRNASLVAVSSGLLKDMTSDEAEAVIAHEISHIANGDMVTMTLIQGIMNTFVIFLSRLISQVIYSLFNHRDVEKENNGASAVYFLVSTVLEFAFCILASLITMWFSRHREFYADAGSAKLVGREKMIAALQRLKISYAPQEKGTLMAFFINGKSKSFSKLLMSHPPLDQRIEALRCDHYQC